MEIIKINIAKKIASAVGTPLIVCGNSDYQISFTFDAEWDTYYEKTARFLFLQDGIEKYIDVLFAGTTCQAPILNATEKVTIGVYAGNLHTTTGAEIKCKKSVLCGGKVHEEPEEDVYNQIIEQLSGSNGKLAQEIAVERARITALATLKDGSTTGDAELMDGRIDRYGNEHKNIGNAIRMQDELVNTKLDNVIIPVALSPITIYEDKAISNDGQIYDNVNSRLKLVKIEPSTNYYIGRLNSGRNFTLFLDETKEIICNYTSLYPIYNTIITTPNNAHYIIYWMQDGYDDLIIEETMYEKYGKVRGAISDEVAVDGFIDIDSTTFKRKYMVYNMHNPATDIEGQYFDVNGVGAYVNNPSYCATEKIPVEPNQTLKFMQENGEYFNCRMIGEFDDNGFFIGGVQNVWEYTQHDNVASIVVSLRMGTERNAMISDASAKTYIPYNDGEYLNEKYLIKGGNIGGASTVKSNKTTSITIDAFPKYLKTAQSLTFRCKFDNFQSIKIGKGYNTYRGHWLNIYEDSIIHYKYEENARVVEIVQYNLKITNFLNIVLDIDGNDAKLTLNTRGDSFTHTFNFECEACGTPFVVSEQELKDVVFSATSKSFNKDVWMFGDSYFGVNDTRTIGQLKNLGIFEDVLVDGLAGQSSSGAFEELQKALKYGTPKYIVWCLGMNDGDSSYQSNLNNLKNICQTSGIELILATIPTTPTRDKEVISDTVRSSGHRYIDFYSSVGANSSGEWYYNYLSDDEVHPTDLGAKALAMQVLIDFPEILKYRN